MIDCDCFKYSISLHVLGLLHLFCAAYISMVRYPSYLRRQSLVSKKHLKLFTLLVMLLFFSISCSTLDEADKIQDVKVEAEVSSDCAETS